MDILHLRELIAELVAYKSIIYIVFDNPRVQLFIPVNFTETLEIMIQYSSYVPETVILLRIRKNVPKDLSWENCKVGSFYLRRQEVSRNSRTSSRRGSEVMCLNCSEF